MGTKRIKLRTTFKKMKKVLSYPGEIRDETLLLKTGAKATYCGGGWWIMYGYTGNDLDPLIKQL